MKSLDKSSACDKTVHLLSGLICQRMGFRVVGFLENVLPEWRRKFNIVQNGFNTKELRHTNICRES